MNAPILLLDLGNTRLKWAWSHEGRLQDPRALDHRGRPIGPLLNDAFRGSPTPGGILVCSVAATPTTAALKAWLQGRWPLHPHFVRSQRQALGVTNGYHDHRRLGVDRWVALIGAYHHHGGELCLFDCGSALTFDAIDAQGQHLGGAILPGLGLMQRLLEDELGLDAQQHGQVEPNLLARSTEDGIATGTLASAAAFVERAHQRLDRGRGRWRCLLSGGDADAIAAQVTIPVQIEPLLVLKGLALIAEHTQ